MNDYYVYIFLDPKTQNPIYVGKGKDLRYFDHLIPVIKIRSKQTTNKRLLNTLRKRRLDGYGDATILCPNNCLTEEQAFEIEKYYIEKFGREDLGTGTLFNLTKGGTGGAISPEIVKASHNTPEYLESASKKTTEYWANLSDEDRQRRRDAVKRSYTPELRKKRSESVKKTNASRTKEERSEIVKRGHANRSEEKKAETRAKLSKSLKASSLFVTNNPQSISVELYFGKFPSKTKAILYYMEHVDKTASRWKAEQIINKLTKQQSSTKSE